MVYYPSMPLIMKTGFGEQQLDQMCSTTMQMLDSVGGSVGSDGGGLFPQERQNYITNFTNGSDRIHHPENTTAMMIQQRSEEFSNSLANIGQLSVISNPQSSLMATNVKAAESVATATTSGPYLGPVHPNNNVATNGLPQINPYHSANIVSSTGGRSLKPTFKCEQCGMVFGSKSAHTSHTKTHLKKANQMESSPAPVVAQSMSGTATMSTETVTAVDSPLPVLPAAGAAKLAAVKSNSSATSDDPYKCNVCLKMFTVPARLIRHYRTHTGERPFECEFCHKLFSVKENLQVHRRIHTKERPYKCDVCGRAFEHSGKLHRHMRIHTGERPHKCSVCEKTFIQSGQLVIHMRTHTGEKPYKCPVEGCGKGFTCSKQLKVHSRTHTGEKPYHCDICFRDFGYNHVLKLHRVQHYGAKCYKCTICDKTFKNKKEMEAHIKRHANKLPEEEEEEEGGQASTKNGPSKMVISSSSSSTSSGIECNSAPNSSPPSPSCSLKNIPTDNACVLAPADVTSNKGEMPTQSSSNGCNSTRTDGKPSQLLLQLTSPPVAITPSPRQSFAVTTTLGELHPRTYFTNSLTIGEMVPTDLSSTITSSRYEAGNEVSSSQRMPAMQQKNQNPELMKPYGTGMLFNYEQQSHGVEGGNPSTFNNQVTIQEQQQSQAQQQHLNSTMSSEFARIEAVHHQAPRNMMMNCNSPIISNSSVPEYAAEIMPAHCFVSNANNLNEIQQCNAAPPINEMVRSALPDSLPRGAVAMADKIDPNICANISRVSVNPSEAINDIKGAYNPGENIASVNKLSGAPVPRYESSLINNEMIVKKVEAAIAPLDRGKSETTESTEDRSSSPESESSLMLADRDVMTLPLRKRKHYMNEMCGYNTHRYTPPKNAQSGESGTCISNNTDTPTGGNVCSSPKKSWNTKIDAETSASSSANALRLNSVIQYAKAS